MNNNSFKYIKLGVGNCWADHCISNNIIRIGFNAGNESVFEMCIQRRWERVEDYWKEYGVGTPRQHTNQMRSFFESGSSVVWVTFHKNRLYYCEIDEDSPFIRLADENGSEVCERLVNSSGWKSTDANGTEIFLTSLSTSLTKTGSYRQTICDFSNDVSLYIDRIINCRDNHLDLLFGVQKKAILETLQKAILNLHWKDFEILVDLIFTNLGLKRLGAVGQGQKFFDIAYYEPISKTEYFVQVKTKSSSDDVKRHKEEFAKYKNFNAKFIFVTNSRIENNGYHSEQFELWSGMQITELAFSNGLADWIMKRTL